MSMALIAAIRKLGWPDRKGRLTYGNAAILCYLSSHNAQDRHCEEAKTFARRYGNVLVSDLKKIRA